MRKAVLQTVLLEVPLRVYFDVVDFFFFASFFFLLIAVNMFISQAADLLFGWPYAVSGDLPRL
jgi:hypothetical protein